VNEETKFGGQVGHIKFQPTDDKSYLKGAWSCHMTSFKFLVPLKYLEDLKLRLLILYIGCPYEILALE